MDATSSTAAASSVSSADEKRRHLVAQSLGVGNPTRLGHTLPDLADPTRECPIEVSVDDIRPYDHNPRRGANPKFEEIKESIRTGGLRSPLTVTREPGAPHYVVEAGGNTRLRALHQLWIETRDPRFGRLTVLFRPWRGHSHVLSAHLTENEQRGDMSFWDKACGVAALKASIESERGGTALTLRTLEDALHQMGMSVNTATLGLYLFATERLRTLAQAFPGISGLDVKTLQPKLNALKREVMTYAKCSEEDVYARAFELAFTRIAESLTSARSLNLQLVVEACGAAAQEAFGPFGPSESVHSSAAEHVGRDLETGASGASLSTSNPLPELRLAGPPDCDPRRHFQAFAMHTGFKLPEHGSLGVTGLSGWMSEVEEDSIASLSHATHRQAWRCLRKLAAAPPDSTDSPDTAVRDDASLVSWMFDAEDPAATSFRELVQAILKPGQAGELGHRPGDSEQGEG
jgi:ParB family protein of integrating conjugative element (PFGI_1 class)